MSDKMINDFNKINRVISSCENMDHINVVRQMYKLFCRKYPVKSSIVTSVYRYNIGIFELRDRLICSMGEQAIHIKRRDLLVAPAHCDYV